MKNLAERDFIEQVLNRDDQPLPATAHQPLAHLIEQAVSANPGTARTYRPALGLFLQYLETQRSDHLPAVVKERWCPFAVATTESRRTVWTFRPPAVLLRWVDKADFEGFIIWRAAEGDGTNTILKRVSAVKSLFRTAYAAGVIDERQVLQLDIHLHQQYREPILTPPEPEPTGRWLTAAEVRLLRGVIETSTQKGKRDLALLDCILYLGLRPDELRALTWSDFETSDDWWFTLNHDQPFRHRCTKVHPVLRLSLAAWFSVMDFWVEPAVTPLFVNIDKSGTIGRRVITTIAIEQTVNRYGVLAGIALPKGLGRLTPPILRRTCGHQAFANGASLRQVQKLLGHSTIDLAASFIGAFDQDERTAVDYIRYD